MGLLDNPNALISVVNPRGRVMWVKPWEVDNLRKQGCRLIINPREEYYPEYDNELNKLSTNRDIADIANPDILEVEEL